MTAPAPAPSPLAKALGRMPSGLYLVTTKGADEQPLGFLGSFVQQVGFEPPTVCVAVGKDRDHLAAMRASGGFAISVLDADSRGLMKPFFSKPEPGTSPFDGLETEEQPGGPVFPEALAWLDCEITAEQDIGDHVVVFGTVRAGECKRDGDPSFHTRKNGLSY